MDRLDKIKEFLKPLANNCAKAGIDCESCKSGKRCKILITNPRDLYKDIVFLQNQLEGEVNEENAG